MSKFLRIFILSVFPKVIHVKLSNEGGVVRLVKMIAQNFRSERFLIEDGET